MSAPTLPARCPTCTGPLLADHPAGMVLQHVVTCPVLAAEDATHAADVQRVGRWPVVRPATPTERTLLGAAPGWTLTVTVAPITDGIVRRTFDEVAPPTPPDPAVRGWG